MVGVHRVSHGTHARPLSEKSPVERAVKIVAGRWRTALCGFGPKAYFRRGAASVAAKFRRRALSRVPWARAVNIAECDYSGRAGGCARPPPAHPPAPACRRASRRVGVNVGDFRTLDLNQSDQTEVRLHEHSGKKSKRIRNKQNKINH